LERFTKDDLVVVRDVISTRRKGQRGRVVEVHPSRKGNATLDKYVVLFSDGKQEELWSIQLQRSDESQRQETFEPERNVVQEGKIGSQAGEPVCNNQHADNDDQRPASHFHRSKMALESRIKR
jgi:hypothetical protein